MAYQYITSETANHVTTITINRPEVKNALHPPASGELGQAFDAFRDDPEAWVAILTGAGESAFSAGNDLKVAASGETFPDVKWSGGFGGITARTDLDKPVIAAVNGFALGGGFELALACDMIVAAENASFGLPEPRVGFVAAAGGMQRLPRMIPMKLALGMMLRAKAIDAGVKLGCTVARASIVARDMVNEPANHMTPSRMAEAAQKVANDHGLKIQVLDNPEMKKMGMGAFMGVAQGTDEPAKLIVLRYEGDPGNPENNLGLIGKGITFDTGGISLKPPAGMEAMKGDMAGGASVIAAMQIIGQVKPKINVLAVIAATENMPGASAQRPGDVVRAMNGKTIEVINTDAEGRLVLADALCYAREQGITRLVDVATLTGAMVTTLGKACTGVMGNDDKLVQQTIDAGKKTGEKFWELPMFDEYKDLIKSDVADMKNSGGRQAGSISAALLLAEFVDGAAWVHLDIAGTSTSDKASGYLVKGATGVPVRTLAQLAVDLAEEGAPKKSRSKSKAK